MTLDVMLTLIHAAKSTLLNLKSFFGFSHKCFCYICFELKTTRYISLSVSEELLE